jgi:hypothetical protein
MDSGIYSSLSAGTGQEYLYYFDEYQLPDVMMIKFAFITSFVYYQKHIGIRSSNIYNSSHKNIINRGVCRFLAGGSNCYA